VPSLDQLPHIEPIIPIRWPEPFDDPAWAFEPKYDGFRGILYVAGGRAHLRSRNGQEFARFAGLADLLRRHLEARDAILDGEILSLDASGLPSFSALMRGTGRLAYAAFDCLWLNGHDLRALPLAARKRRLAILVPDSAGTIFRAFTHDAQGQELFEAACAHDLEGIVAKRHADPYSDRTEWRKVLNPRYTQREGRGELFRDRAVTEP
jgi:bifunctional non-homologous end joining protein LigD